MLRPYKSKHYLVVGKNHGCNVSSMGVKRYTNDIKRACDTLEEAELTVRQQNTPVYCTNWPCVGLGYSPEDEEMYRITQEAYE